MADKDKAVKEEPKTAEEVSGTLPIDSEVAPDKNEAWAQMRAENKALVEERDKLTEELKSRDELSVPYEQQAPVYQRPTAPQTPNQWTNWGQQQVDPNAFRDPVTGEIDEYRRTQAVNQAIAAAQNNATANAQNFATGLVKEEVDWAVARMKFPELDTNQDFAEDVWGQYLIERQRNPQTTPLEVVNKVQARWDRLAKREEKAVDKQAEAATVAKQQATSETEAFAPSVGKVNEAEEEEEEDELLRAKTRGVVGNAFSGQKISKADQELAIIERLKKKSWAVPETEETT